MIESNLDMLVVIVSSDKGSKVLSLAKEKGVKGGTIFLGKGTANQTILDYLGLNDKKKALIMMVGDEYLIKKAGQYISQYLHFDKVNTGIAYVESVMNVLGAKHCKSEDKEIEDGGEIMYNAIYTIVDRGVADDVITAAESAGSKGGTVINARGSGIHETKKVFNMLIEPEKELVLIISESSKTKTIVDSIREKIKIDEPGKGIMFVTEVKDTYGIVK